MRVVLDTDPAMGVLGGDPEDAFAILMALEHPDVDLAAVTVVNGNVPLDLGYANARHLLRLHGSEHVPLAAGPAAPLLPYRTDQLAWQAAKRELPRLAPAAEPPAPSSAPELIARTVLGSPEPVTLVAIGPLTNVALAVQLEPSIAQAVDRVVVMGGTGREPGNVTPAAEFNFWCDPEAAAVVFAAGWPITLVTLEVCHQVRLTGDRLAGLGGSPLADYVTASCAPWLDALERGGEAGIPMFDTLTLASVVAPELVKTRPAWVEIDTTTGPSQGASAIRWDTDVLGRPLPATNAEVSVGVDADGFLELFTEHVLNHL
ncbi:nucleoside hydrolase [Jiangella rhizosphaerae]|nr:nucleoside hydrolase [Jiangella rhizosphaerae]